ncbi:hypothetical protein BO99DRAFT_249292 [Aspergillus violaceofuscus CBS 115571]|uniref:Uncharacterized protein n=1 Tax=Aspergillus violaceofuscus (strain CBS 115571) TaxID=1450538 RepID=A0A2V5I7E0_ASPV1|nr:hypothetical protein BO99DRAFT_249292 [Aspergillus violaceofuscus CBS 115571]
MFSVSRRSNRLPAGTIAVQTEYPVRSTIHSFSPPLALSYTHFQAVDLIWSWMISTAVSTLCTLLTASCVLTINLDEIKNTLQQDVKQASRPAGQPTDRSYARNTEA